VGNRSLLKDEGQIQNAQKSVKALTIDDNRDEGFGFRAGEEGQKKR